MLKWTNQLITAPSIEPVTVDQLRSHLRLDTTVDDEYLETLITAARELFEEQTQRSLIQQTWSSFLDAAPCGGDGLGWWDGVRQGSIKQNQPNKIELPKLPVYAFDFIKSYDDDDTATEFDADNYHVELWASPVYVALKNGAVWPTPTRSTNGLEFRYKSGYGPNATDVPAAIRQCLMILAAHWYENREIVVIGTITSTLPQGAQKIINKYKVMRL